MERCGSQVVCLEPHFRRMVCVKRKRSIIRPVVNAPLIVKEGDLAAMAKTILYKDLTRPPKSMRERLALCRAGLECDGVIGPRSTELHLHQHQALPPVVRAMLESKMRELSGLIPELPASVAAPPEPIEGAKEDY
jgi:hypothetical protein